MQKEDLKINIEKKHGFWNAVCSGLNIDGVGETPDAALISCQNNIISHLLPRIKVEENHELSFTYSTGWSTWNSGGDGGWKRFLADGRIQTWHPQFGYNFGVGPFPQSPTVQ